MQDKDIYAPVIDYSQDYPSGKKRIIGYVNYAELKSGSIKIKGRKIPTAGISSLAKAKEIAGLLKSWIEKKKFYLTQPVASLPGAELGPTNR